MPEDYNKLLPLSQRPVDPYSPDGNTGELYDSLGEEERQEFVKAFKAQNEQRIAFEKYGNAVKIEQDVEDNFTDFDKQVLADHLKSQDLTLDDLDATNQKFVDEYVDNTRRLKEIEKGDKYKQEFERASKRADDAEGFWNAENWLANFDYAKQGADNLFGLRETGNTDKEEAEYKQVNRKLKEFREPYLNKLKEQNQKKYDDIKLSFMAANTDENLESKGFNREGYSYSTAMKIYEDKISTINKYLDSNIENNAEELLKGLAEPDYNIVDNVATVATMYNIKKKLENKEKLSESEDLLYKAYSDGHEFDTNIKQSLTKGRFAARIGEGVGESVKFMGEMYVVQGVGGASKKVVATGLSQKIGRNIAMNSLRFGTKSIASKAVLRLGSVTTKFINNAAYLLPSTAAMPSTYTKAGEKYIGDVSYFDTEEGPKYMFDEGTKETFIQEGSDKMSINEEELTRLYETKTKSPEQTERIENLEKENENIREAFDSIYETVTDKNGKLVKQIPKDFSKLEAMWYGYSENLKETTSEMVVGSVASKAFGKLGTLASDNRIGRMISPLGNVSNRFWGKGKKFINSKFETPGQIGKLSQNAMYHTGASKMWNGLPSEVLEEVAVQLTPTYREDYSKQLEELSNPQFYIDVIAQTMLMGGGFTALNSGQHGYGYLTSKKYRDSDKKQRELKTGVRDLYKKMDESVKDDELANHILMNTAGTLYEVQDYQAKAAQLRKEGKKEEASKLEEKSFLNIMANALMTDTVSDLEKSLTKVSQNTNLNEDTKKNAIKALAMIPKFNKIKEQYSGFSNTGELFNLATNRIYNEQGVEEVTKEIRDIENDLSKYVAQYKKNAGLDESSFSINDLYSQLTRLSNQEKDIVDRLEKAKTKADSITSGDIPVKKKYNDEVTEIRKELTAHKKRSNDLNGFYNFKKDDVDNLLALHQVREMYEKADYENVIDLQEKSSGEYQAKLKTEKRQEEKKRVESVTTEEAAKKIADTTDDAEIQELAKNKERNIAIKKSLNPEKEKVTNKVIQDSKPKEHTKKPIESGKDLIAEASLLSNILSSKLPPEVANERVEEPAPTQQTSNVESQKADIEKRRQEELDKRVNDKFTRVQDQTENLEDNQKASLKIGTPYNEGMKVTATFVEGRTDTSKDGYGVITRVIKPQINTDGVMTQSGVVEVTLYDSKEEANKAIELEKEKSKNRLEKKTNEINAKYDAKIAVLESTPTQQTSNVEAQKAEIESRRQKEVARYKTGKLENQTIDVIYKGRASQLILGKWEFTEFGNSYGYNRNDVKDIERGTITDKNNYYGESLINAKYDSELEALESQSAQKVEDTTEDEKQAAIFGSRQVKTDTVTPEQVKKANKFISDIENELGFSPTFSDIINSLVESDGYKKVEDIYEGVTKMLASTGMDTTGKDVLYNQLFNSKKLFLDEVETILSEVDVKQINEDLTDSLQTPSPSIPDDVDQKIDSGDRRVLNGNVKAAFNKQNSRRISETEYAVERDLKNPEDDHYVKNNFVLDSEFMYEVEKEAEENPSVLRAVQFDDESGPLKGVDINGNVELGMVYDGKKHVVSLKASPLAKITWGEAKAAAKKQFGESELYDAWYTQYVPVAVVYNGKQVSEPTSLFMIHDQQWYTEEANNINGKDKALQSEIYTSGQLNISNLRKEVAKEGNLPLKMTARNFGQTHNPTDIESVATNSPQSELMVLKNIVGDKLIVEGADGEFNKGILLNKNFKKLLSDSGNPRKGLVMHLNFIRKNSDGVNEYAAFPTLNYNPNGTGELKRDLDEGVFSTIKYAVLASVILNNKDNKKFLSQIEEKYNFTLEQAEVVSAEIKKGYGLSVTDSISEFMGKFINVSNSISDIYNYNDKPAKKGMGYVKHGKNGTFEFARIGDIPVKDETSKEDKTSVAKTIGGKTTYTDTTVKYLDELFNDNNGIIRKFPVNLNLKFLSHPTPVKLIGADGTFNGQKAQPYSDLIKNYFETNIISHKIADSKGNEKWITDIQPGIYLEPTNAKGEIIDSSITPQEVKKESVGEQDNYTAMHTELVEQGMSEEDANEFVSDMRATEEGLKREEGKYNSRVTLDAVQSEALKAFNTNKIEGLTPNQQKELIDSLKHSIATKLSELDSISKKSIITTTNSEIESFLDDEIERKNKQITILESLSLGKDNLEQQKSILAKLVLAKEQKEKVVGSLMEEFANLFSLDVGDLMADSNDTSESWSKASYERDISLSFGEDLLLSFYGIPKKTSAGTVIKNTFSTPSYHSADDIRHKLLDVTSSIQNSWKQLEDALDRKYKMQYFGKVEGDTEGRNPLYLDLRNKLNSASLKVKAEILHKMVSNKVTLTKVLLSPGKPVMEKGEVVKADDGSVLYESYTTTILDENGKKAEIQLTKHIKKSFYEKFGKVQKGEIVLNKDFSKNILNSLDKLQNSKETDPKVIAEVFNQIGFDVIENNTFEQLTARQGLTVDGTTFDLYDSTRGIVGLLRKELGGLLEKYKDKDVVLNKDVNIYENISTPLRQIIGLEIDINNNLLGSSIRVAGKTISTLMPTSEFFDTNQKLLIDDVYTKQLLDTAYAGNNYILQALEKDPKLKAVFNKLSFPSIEAMKIHNRDTFGNSEYDKLSNQDSLKLSLNLYMNTNLDKLKNTKIAENYPYLNFRIGTMPSLTIADKGRTVYQTIPLLNFTQEEVTLSGNEIKLDDSLTAFLTEQTFGSELNRILSSQAKKQPYKGYNKSAQAFYTIADFNTINIEHEGETLNIHEVLTNLVNGELTTEVKDKLIEEAKKKVESYIKAEVDNKISKTSEGVVLGELVESGIYKAENDKYGVSHINTKYVKDKKGDKNYDKLRYTMVEFVSNNLINNMSTTQLYLGDPAFYSKPKHSLPLTENGVLDVEKANSTEYWKTQHEAVGAVIQKRTAKLIAPGNKLADSENPSSRFSQDFNHIALEDVESMSSGIKELIESQYGDLTKEQTLALEEVGRIRDTLNETTDTDTIKELQDRLSDVKEKHFSEIADYFNIEGTDAQGYVTWKGYLEMLERQGKITEEQNKTYTKQILEEELSEKELNSIMSINLQPTKPVYSGVVPENGVNRPVYIKMSEFPLFPQLTKGLKLDGLRNLMEDLETEATGEGRLVPTRASYQSANKIGSLDTQLTMQEVYAYDNLTNTKTLDTAVSNLPMSGFRIQQETPSKEAKYFKKGKDSYITAGSQMSKGILGNFINKIDTDVFPNIFTDEMLELAGIDKRDNLTGIDLDKIYFKTYSMYSDLLSLQLETELGLGDVSFDKLTETEQNETIKKLHKILSKEIAERNHPKYLKHSLNLIEEKNKVLLESVLMFDNNRHKFESLLQAVISNKVISHSLPGNSHVSASSEGFENVTSLDKLDDSIKSRVVWTKKVEGELKATMVTDNNGNKQISASQVLMKAHWKYTDADGNYKYVDLTEDKYHTIDEVTGRKMLDTSKIDESLLSMFSFRIPTSSHQSGALLEVVGFLPSDSQDLLVVPKEHTVQLGEDYDIDKRSVYKSNYFVDKDGNIKKLNKKIIDQAEKEKNKGDSEAVKKLLSSIFGESADEVKEFGASYTERELQIKLLENVIIDIHKSVYSSTSNDVQKKIFKPLTTDLSDLTCRLMDKKLSRGSKSNNFSIFSDSYQRRLLKNGADGKGGIGVHSNAVVFEAQVQRSSYPISIKDYKKPIGEEPAEMISFSESIGSLKSSSLIGEEKNTLDGDRNISDQHAENQNNSTDNVNKGNMASRNENAYTMGVYAMTAHLGFDKSLDNIDTGIEVETKETEIGKNITVKYEGASVKAVVSEKNKAIIKDNIHIPSILMNQPILRDYVRLMDKYNSITSEFTKEKEKQITKELSVIYGFEYNAAEQEITNFIEKEIYETSSEELTGKALWNMLDKKQALKYPMNQAAILQKFNKFNAKAKELSEIHKLINLSTSKLGISYFVVLQKVNKLNEVGQNQLEQQELGLEPNNYTKLIGDVSSRPGEGFHRVGDLYWKPTTYEGKMLINSLLAAEKVMPTFFPYNSPGIKYIINNVINVKGDSNKNTESNLTWKYQIMTEFVNYINSDSGTFENTTDEERNRLFYDNESTGHKSLGHVIKLLKQSKHPIMENPFLKDLEVDNNVVQGMHTIKSPSTEETNFDKSSKYEAFLELFQDDTTVLGEFNGEQLKASDLAQDLVAYAYLSDDKNGALGFKGYIPVEYLSTVGVTANHRKLFDDIKSNNTSIEGITENFVRQYFQHNPERAVVASTERFEEIKSSEEDKPRYVSIRNTDKDSSLQQWDLHEYNDDIKNYKQVTILGDGATYKEYDMSKREQSSSVNDKKLNQVGDVYNKGGNKYIVTSKDKNIPVSTVEQVIRKNETVGDLLGFLEKSKNTSEEYKAIIREYRDYVTDEVKLEWVSPGPRKVGAYDSTTNTIQIAPNFLESLLSIKENDLTKAQEAFREIVLEEVLHSLTVNNLKDFIQVDENSQFVQYKTENPPTFVTMLVNMYEKAKESVPYNKNDISTYYSQNIFEFIAGIYVAPDYVARLEDKNSGFLDRFSRMLKSLFSHLWSKSEKSPSKEYKDYFHKAVKELITKTEVEVEEATEKNVSDPKATLDKIKKDEGDLSTEPKRPLDTVQIDEVKPRFVRYGNEIHVNETDGGLMDELPTEEEAIKALKEWNVLPQQISEDGIEAMKTGILEKKYEEINNLISFKNGMGGYTYKNPATGEIGTGKELQAKINKRYDDEIAALESTNENRVTNIALAQTVKPTSQSLAPKTEKTFSYKGTTIDTKFVLGEQQVEALEAAIDYVLEDNTNDFFTIEGSAGTGKTTIIGYLQKYLANKSSRDKFIYIAPTHAAVSQLAMTTVELGNKDLPRTLASTFYDFTIGGQRKVNFTTDVLKQIQNKNPIFIVDETSMVEDNLLKSFIETAKNVDAKVVFMGDSNQIPSPDGKSINSKGQKVLNRAFGDSNSVELTQVYRQSSSDLLDKLGEIKNNIHVDTNINIGKNDGTLLVLEGRAYNEEVLEAIKADPENTTYIAYTNKAVKAFNNTMKEELTGTSSVQVGDKLVGYLGKGTKQIKKGNIANSISYIIDDVEHRIGTSIIDISGVSKLLENLEKKGVEDVSGMAESVYIQLSTTDSLTLDSVTAEEMQSTNKAVSEEIEVVYNKYNEIMKMPSSSRKWAMKKDVEDNINALLGKYDLGDKYYFNPKTVMLELTPSIANNALNTLFTIDKGLDYGYGITAHKSQGMTISTAFVDVENITNAGKTNPEIINKKGDIVNTEKNALYYVAMSRSKKVVIKKSPSINLTYNSRQQVFKEDIDGLPLLDCE